MLARLTQLGLLLPFYMQLKEKFFLVFSLLIPSARQLIVRVSVYCPIALSLLRFLLSSLSFLPLPQIYYNPNSL